MLRGQLKVADRYLSGEPDAPPLPAILGLFGHHPRLTGSWLAFNSTLLENARIAPQDRELLVLRVAWRTQSSYEWTQHTRIAREVGLTPEQLLAVTDLDAEVWSPQQRDLMAVADQMVCSHQVDDETWGRLAARYDEAELLELVFVVGAYTCLAIVCNSVDLQADSGPDVRSAELPKLEESR